MTPSRRPQFTRCERADFGSNEVKLPWRPFVLERCLEIRFFDRGDKATYVDYFVHPHTL